MNITCNLDINEIKGLLTRDHICRKTRTWDLLDFDGMTEMWNDTKDLRVALNLSKSEIHCDRFFVKKHVSRWNDDGTTVSHLLSWETIELKAMEYMNKEEYNYNLQLNRKKEIDTYEQKKVLLEKELHDKKATFENDFAERESTIAEKEKVFAELEAKVEQFPKQLENAIKETEKSVLEKIEFKYKHQSELEQKEIAGERNLNKQMILSLENKIKEQAEQIKQFTQKVNEASQQVQTIAIKAIESASGGTSSQRMFTPGYERTNEQQKKGTD